LSGGTILAVSWEGYMRTFIAALVGVVLLSASNYNPEGRPAPDGFAANGNAW
jgi:hypothetical protein